MARNAVTFQLAFNDDLRGNAGMVGARLPQRVGAAHAVVTGQCIHQGLIKTMPHVQCAGDIGRRQQNAESFFLGRIVTGGKVTAVFPSLVPAAFDIGGFEGFCKRHDERLKSDGLGRSASVRFSVSDRVTAIFVERHAFTRGGLVGIVLADNLK